MGKYRTILAMLAFASLSACGDTLAEQAIIGAGVGAVGATAADGDAITGAAVGAAANVAYCRRYPHRC